ncbi:MAG: hypothetical protein IKJ19_00210 [Clostridia bacterium]|nr:hypothetical protein [Clostridia bacterium]
MKKIVTKIVTLIVVCVMSLTTLFGCGLITVNTDRDMAQVIAKVQVSENVNAEEIKKSELVSGFLSYGYMYVQYYGYTEAAAYEMVLDGIVQNRIIIQSAREALAKDYNEKTKDNDFMNYFYDNALAGEGQINSKPNELKDLEKYLTAYEKAQAYYNVKVSIDQLIDSYMEAEDEEEKEDETFTARAVPTVDASDAKYEYELKQETPTEYDYKKAALVLGSENIEETYTNLYDLNLAVYNEYEIDLVKGSEDYTKRLKAFNKALKNLQDAGVISSKEHVDVRTHGIDAILGLKEGVKGYEYFVNTVKSQYESLIVAKYEDSLISEYEGKLTNEMLFAQYVTEYEAQEINYTNNVANYESALESATKDSFVLCNPYEDYGYVLNLLIGFSEEQTAALNAKEVSRNDLLKELVAKDQRITWAQSSYGDFANNVFTFGEDYIVSENSKDLLGEYIGTLLGAKESTIEDENGVEKPAYSFENIMPKSIGIEEFVSTYLNTFIGTAIDLKTNVLSGKLTDWNDAKRDMFEDLLYAFSTDPGSLGTYMGYVYSPKTSSTTYVKEFADAAARVVSAGVGAYELVATDYGYHLILCTKVIEKETSRLYADVNAFMADVEIEGTLAYNYKKAKSDAIVSAKISEKADLLVNQLKEKEGVVTKFPKTYEDLIPEESSSEDEHNH